MHFTCLLLLIFLKICASAVLFRIHSNNTNIVVNSSYLFGTAHIAQNLIWPYLSTDVLRILTENDEVWMEHDFTDLQRRKYLYRCQIDSMTRKQLALRRAKTWSQFLNETKRKNSNDRSMKSKKIKNSVSDLIKWRKWLIKKYTVSKTYLWRNRTISDDILFDHRIILEAYRRGIYVGSLESLPKKCSSEKKSSTSSAENKDIILSRLYNCDVLDEDFLNELFTVMDLSELKTRNKQITKQIRKLLKKAPHKKYVFAVGAAHLFGNISIIQMLKDQYKNDYYIEQIDAPSRNFPYCTDEELTRLENEIESVQNKSITKRFIQHELFDFFH